MTNHPKFGYHWVWILPLAYVYCGYYKAADATKKAYKFVRKNRSTKRERLRELSGIKDKK